MEKKIDKAPETWLDSQKKDTRCAYRSHWRRFAEFTGKTGDEILASRKKDKEFFWEAKLLEFKSWLTEEKDLSSNSATTATQAIRGFFAFHRVPLQFQRRETRKIGEHVRKMEDYRFSLDDLAKMDAVGDLTEKYVLRAGKSFGLRAGDFLRLTRGDLEPYINKGELPISIGAYKTQKEGVTAWPFIDSDAQPIVKLMLERLTREGETQQSARMLPFTKKLQLSRVLRRLVLKAGLNTGGKQVRFHCMRKFLCDHLSSFMSESKWKQIVGKKISEGAYVSPDTLREDYARAMPETTFTKIASDDIQKIAKLEALKLFAKASGYTTEDIAKIRMRKPKANIDDEIEEIEKILAEKNQAKATKPEEAEKCEDGKHCQQIQQIVAEENLAGYLSQNWKVVATLPSGKIVIES
jgi:integrase